MKMKVFALFALLTGSLAAGELIEVAEVVEEKTPGAREVVYEDVAHQVVLHLGGAALIKSDDVAKVSTVKGGPRRVEVRLSEEGEKKLAEKTKRLEGKRIAILVQGRVMQAPVLRKVPLGGTFYVEGFRDEAEVKGFVEAFEKRGR